MNDVRWEYAVMCAVALSAGMMATACNTAQPKREGQAHNAEARVERGRYLVTVGGCNDCHTPLKMGPKGPEPDMDRMLSGHPETFPITELPASGGQQGSFQLSAFSTQPESRRLMAESYAGSQVNCD